MKDEYKKFTEWLKIEPHYNSKTEEEKSLMWKAWQAKARKDEGRIKELEEFLKWAMRNGATENDFKIALESIK